MQVAETDPEVARADVAAFLKDWPHPHVPVFASDQGMPVSALDNVVEDAQPNTRVYAAAAHGKLLEHALFESDGTMKGVIVRDPVAFEASLTPVGQQRRPRPCMRMRHSQRTWVLS